MRRVLIFTMSSNAQDRTQARSMVISRQGIVATSQTLASQAGAQILARGGSAMDAAIAANAVLGVVEPMSDGIGGDLFAIYWDAKTGKLTGINASGWAPKALSIEYLRQKGISSMPQNGIQSVTVPGCVDGWEKLHQKFGRVPWRDLFQPAIYYAENGFPVTEMIAGAWSRARSDAGNGRERAADFSAQRASAGGGRDVSAIRSWRRALELIADGGAAAFYRGPIAKAHSEDIGPAGRHDGGGGSERICVRMGRADLDGLPRLEGLRTAAERAGHGDARDAEPHGAVSAGVLRRAERGCVPHQDGGAEAGLCGLAALSGRSAIREGAGGGNYVEEICRGARGADRHEAGAVRCGAGRSETIRGRHDLSFGGGSGGEHRVADSERLSFIRVGRGGGRIRISICRIAAGCSRWMRHIRMRWRGGSGRSTRSFRRSWRRGRCTSGSALWAG